MKRSLVILSSSLLLICCGSEKLTKEMAYKQIKEELNFPKIIDWDLYCADLEHAKKAIDAGLEEKGFVTVQRTQKLKDLGDPLIQFTDKATPYLLSTAEKDKALCIQKVKIADEDLAGVTSIQTSDDGKNALVEYKVIYSNVSDFFGLVPNKDFTEPVVRRANFILYDDGWKLRGDKLD